MKTLAIGDIHGKWFWRDIVEQERDNVDKIIFIGDYFDTFDDIPYTKQIKNLKDIVKLKQELDVDILLGNHDYHYLATVREHYSGFSSAAKLNIQTYLQPLVNNGIITICSEYDNVIYSHAGITQTWYDEFEVNELEDINRFIIEDPDNFRFRGLDWTGDDPLNGPLWVRPDSLIRDKLQGYKFVVGHTRHDRGIVIREDVAFIDCLDGRLQYLITEDGEFEVKTLCF